MNLGGGDWADGLSISSKWSWFGWLQDKRVQRIAIAAVAGVTIVTAVALELKNSWIESGVFREADRHLSYRLAEGKSASIHYPGAGPYDWTLGYARIPAFLPRLEATRLSDRGASSQFGAAGVALRHRTLSGLSAEGSSRIANRRSRWARSCTLSIVRSASIRLIRAFRRWWSRRYCSSRTGTCWIPSTPRAIQRWNGIAWAKR